MLHSRINILGKKRKRKSTQKPTVSLTEARYQKLLLILIEAWDSSSCGQDLFWDFGSGERPQKIISEFQFVAKKESIPLVITHVGESLKLAFPTESQKLMVRVKSSSGSLRSDWTKIKSS